MSVTSLTSCTASAKRRRQRSIAFSTSNSRPNVTSKADRANTMHEAARLKPVVIDESLLDLESLDFGPRNGLYGSGTQSMQGSKPIVADGGSSPIDGACSCVCRI